MWGHHEGILFLQSQSRDDTYLLVMLTCQYTLSNMTTAHQHTPTSQLSLMGQSRSQFPFYGVCRLFGTGPGSACAWCKILFQADVGEVVNSTTRCPFTESSNSNSLRGATLALEHRKVRTKALVPRFVNFVAALTPD